MRHMFRGAPRQREKIICRWRDRGRGASPGLWGSRRECNCVGSVGCMWGSGCELMLLLLQDIGELCVQSAQCKSGCCQRDTGLSLARCSQKAAETQGCSRKVGAVRPPPVHSPAVAPRGAASPSLCPHRASMEFTTSVPVRVACPATLTGASWAPSPTLTMGSAMTNATLHRGDRRVSQ